MLPKTKGSIRWNTDEFAEWFDFIDRYDSALIGEPNRLQGIVTAMDILRYLYRVASPFVLLAEFELALRADEHPRQKGTQHPA
jgi:hypothetical protein